MEPSENHELTDHELDAMLREWRTPPVPAGLRAAVFPEQVVPWWQRSIRLPIPVAALAALVLALALWRAAVPNPARVIEHFDTKVVYRELPPGARSLTFHDLRPVGELRPRIIRSGHAEN